MHFLMVAQRKKGSKNLTDEQGSGYPSWQDVPGILKTVIVAINSVGSELGYNVQEGSK